MGGELRKFRVNIETTESVLLVLFVTIDANAWLCLKGGRFLVKVLGQVLPARFTQHKFNSNSNKEDEFLEKFKFISLRYSH